MRATCYTFRMQIAVMIVTTRTAFRMQARAIPVTVGEALRRCPGIMRIATADALRMRATTMTVPGGQQTITGGVAQVITASPQIEMVYSHTGRYVAAVAHTQPVGDRTVM